MLIKSVFILTLLVSFSSAAYVRIGNGGEGVLENGQIYVRDLYEQNSHLNPWFGGSTSPALLEAWNKTNLSKHFSEARELILRKLTDIEKVYPGLGFVTLSALDKYDYFFVEHLELLENDSPSVPDSVRVQIAMRRYKTVYLSKSAWKIMSVESRAALLIHEGIYGLATIVCNQEACEQKSRAVRPLIGQLFFMTPQMDVNNEIRKVLQVQSMENLCANPIAQFRFAVVSEADRAKVYQSFQSQYFSRSEELRKDIQRICRVGENYTDRQVAVMYDGQIFFQSLNVKIYKMKIKEELETQQGFFTRVSRHYGRKFISFTNSERCELHLNHLVHQSFEIQKRTATIDPSVACLGALGH